MATFQFSKASKKKAKLRLALMGVSGSGKTYTALSIAKGLGKRVALIDTEHGSASKYSDFFEFDVVDLESFSVDNYTAAISEAVKAKYDVLIIDSLSHAWSGKDGIIEFKDKKAASSGNDFAAWRYATPLHTRFVESILSAPLHIIATMRSEMEYAPTTDDRGKAVIRKLGLAPVQRKGIEYEFDLVGDINLEHQLIITKSRIPGFADEVFNKPNERLGEKLLEWLDSGAEMTPRPEPQLVAPASKPEPKKEAPVPTPTPAEPAPQPAESEGFTVEQAHDFIPAKTGQYAGMRLRDYPTELLGTVISSPKASERLHQMAYVVLEMREAGDAAPEETIAPEPEQEVQQQPLA